MSMWLFIVVNLFTTARQDHIESAKWESVKRPRGQSPAAIGSYAKGCVLSAKPLPARGRGFQTMRPSRSRNYGHPSLLRYIKAFGRRIKNRGLGTLLVGDLGQPMGGPSPNGHASHQTGLDVDIWFWRAPVADERKLTKKERETLSAPSFVNRAKQEIKPEWDAKSTKMLKLATQDKRVARIFVNPVIKRHICESEKKRDWLHKIRPWYGHRDHMHVRLSCPKGSAACEDQKPLPKGDGCDSLDWWFKKTKKSARKKGRKSYQKKVRSVPVLPDACYEVYSRGPKAMAP